MNQVSVQWVHNENKSKEVKQTARRRRATAQAKSKTITPAIVPQASIISRRQINPSRADRRSARPRILMLLFIEGANLCVPSRHCPPSQL